MTTFQFDNSRLKIKRAHIHIEELRSAFDAFLNTDFCRLVIENDAQSGSQLIRVESAGSPPAEISLMIGDAVHNLRSALDYAAVQIINSIPGLTKEERKQAAFPVSAQRGNPGSHPAYRLIKKAFPDLALLLTDKISIHDTGSPCLWAISSLDNIDKHNLLITAVSVQELRGIRLEDKAFNNRYHIEAASLEGGGVVNLINYGGGGNLEVTNKGYPAATILFGGGQPIKGQPVIPSLLKLAELTAQTIEELEHWFGEKLKAPAGQASI